jgi:ribosomal protein S24E
MIKVLEEKNNSLLNRKEIKIIADAVKNPSFPESCKIVADQFKAKEELVEVKEIKGKFGRDTFLISAHIYNNKEDKDKLEKKKEKKSANPAGK